MIGPSPIPNAGMGVIATEDIPPHTVVLIERYDPDLLNQYISNNLLVAFKDQRPHHMTNNRHYTKYTYDWMGPGSALFVPGIAFFNHDNADTNCAFLLSPNATMLLSEYLPTTPLKPIIVMTLRQIKEGEELTMNYYPRTMGFKSLKDRMKELNIGHGAIWKHKVKKSDEKRYIQRLNELNDNGKLAMSLIREFDQTEKRVRGYLSKIYDNDGRSTPEYIDTFVHAIIMFRVIAAINLSYASTTHGLTEQQIDQRLRRNDELIISVLESNFDCTIDELKQAFAKLKAVLADIEIHGPTSCTRPYQHVDQSQSLL
ncbi:SET domain-containing protein-lysine N-methyltransferase, partial [bacterium]|nr:SET domain-containing protein-lysine N-methyltransferase [bacterium]